MIRKWSLKRLRRLWETKYYRKLITLGTVVFLYMLLGSIFYGVVEGWSFPDAFYFTGMTILTIGYGDLVPSTAFSRIFTIVYAFLGIGIVFYAIGVIGKHYVQQEEKRIADIIERRLGVERQKLKKK